MSLLNQLQPTTTPPPGSFDVQSITTSEATTTSSTSEGATTGPTTTSPTTSEGATTTCPHATTTQETTDLIVGIPKGPEEEAMSGCPDPSRERVIIAPTNFMHPVKFPFLDSAGERIIPEACLSSNIDATDVSNGRSATFLDPFDQCYGAHTGRLMYKHGEDLTIDVPAKVRCRPGVYMMEVRWRQESGQELVETGLISIEPSLAQRYQQSQGGASFPLTIREVRTRLRDFPGANDVSGTVQFTTEEILEAIARPVMFWNETAPVISRYSPTNFPFRSHWLDAVVSTLYTTGAHWMLRNDLKIQGEGIAASDRDKWKVMFQYAQKGWDDYRTFVLREKNRENISRAFKVM